MNTKPRTILILTGLFLAGAASGAFLALRLSPHGPARPPERRQFMQRNLERMDRALSFTPEQRPKIEALMRAAGDELTRLRRDSWRDTAQQIQTLNTKIEALLTPEQRTKFAAFQREQLERMRSHLFARDPRGGPPRDGELPPPPEDLPPEAPGEAPPFPPAN